MTQQQAKAHKGNILIVDDTPQNLRLLSTALTEQGYKVRSAINGSLALIGVQAAHPDLILLDIKMPDMDGYEVCQRLKADEETRQIPIIFLSSLDDVFDKVRAFNLGAADYIAKPFQIEEVIARIQNQLTILQLQKNLQQQNTRLQQEIHSRTAAEAEIRQLNLQLENRVKQRTNELEVVNQQLLHLALHDELTGLANRALFMEHLETALQRTREDKNYVSAILFLDCDRFKLINDSFGHLAGDSLLVAIAQRLKTCLTFQHTLARLGGDEFAILLENINGLEDAIKIAKKIQKELAFSFKTSPYEVFIDVSIGIVLVTQDYEKSEHLLRDADTAMYQAKRAGKARYQVFEAKMYQRTLARLKLENDLRRALQRQELIVYYQPIVSLTQGTLVGFEALLRWRHPQHGLVSPQQFIPIAEETGLIIPIGLWVFQQACSQLHSWQENYYNCNTSLGISINLSVKQFAQPDFMENIDRILTQTHLDSESIKLEITESLLIEQTELANQTLKELRSRKMQLALDDFGTGYSSLSYLQRFPIDILKIDRSFIKQIHNNQKNPGIVQTIIKLAHQLGINVIAEGVETLHQIEQLKQWECEEGQGYFFAKPLPPDSVTALIAENRNFLSS